MESPLITILIYLDAKIIINGLLRVQPLKCQPVLVRKQHIYKLYKKKCQFNAKTYYQVIHYTVYIYQQTQIAIFIQD